MKDLFWSCDWGSSSFRLFLVDKKSCEVLGESKSSEGVTKLAKDIQNESIADYCQKYLEEQTQVVLQKSGESGCFPCVLSGMVTSAHGWLPLEYAKVPFSLSGENLKYEKVSSQIEAIDNLFFLSGVKTESDVMRGEETELIGNFQMDEYKKFSENCTVIIPGTHSKHIFIRNNSMIDFKTFMTGEMYELLSQHSVLKHTVLSGNTELSEAFYDGINKSRDNEMLNALFSVRTNGLFEYYSPSDNADFLSALLIGYELKGLEGDSSQILLYAKGKLLKMYLAAIQKLYPDSQVTCIETEKIASIYGHRAFLKNQ